MLKDSELWKHEHLLWDPSKPMNEAAKKHKTRGDIDTGDVFQKSLKIYNTDSEKQVILPITMFID